MNSLLSSVLLALFAVAAVPGALAAPLEERKAETNFSATCSGISFNSGSDNLTATCQNSGGIGTTTTTIGLNSCVGNTNGELTAGKSFSSSCSSISFSGVTLSAICRTPSGGSISTSLDLIEIEFVLESTRPRFVKAKVRSKWPPYNGTTLEETLKTRYDSLEFKWFANIRGGQ
ncbi:hypothetical protein B0H19DRAFT_1229761 [Mycena capillaripes]|nr:hypothetical protein B0H19DRAFT_1229761 [Mycena capillaripes]